VQYVLDEAETNKRKGAPAENDGAKRQCQEQVEKRIRRRRLSAIRQRITSTIHQPRQQK